MSSSLSNRAIVRVMYRETTPPTSDALACTVCDRVVKQKRGSGYKNLISHLHQHPGYEDAALAVIEQKGGAKPAVSFFMDKGASATYRWLELIVKKNLPLTFVGDDIMRCAVNFDPLSYQTFVKRFHRVVEIVEEKIAQDLNDKLFALVFDGFTEGAEHCLGVFAAFDGGMRFLAFSQFDDESSMTADEHIDFLDSLMDDYKLEATNLVCIVSDNMSTNRAISKKTTIPMVGCASHRLSLAVKDWLIFGGKIDLLKKISFLMRKLRSVKRWAKLKENGCKTKPMRLHELRWMGYYDLLSRYLKIRSFLHLFEDDQESERPDDESSGPDSDDDDKNDENDDAGPVESRCHARTVVELIPSAAEHNPLKQLHEDMESIAYITRSLQGTSRTIAEVRDLFDILIADFPVMANRLAQNASIVQSVAFESALCKIQAKSEASLRPAEAATVLRLLRARSSTVQQKTTPVIPNKGKRKRTADDIHELLKAKKQRRIESESRYRPTEWIPPTSVAVERVFPQVKAVTGYLRRSMSPRTLDGLLVLKLNWDLVTIDVVSDAIKSLREETELPDTHVSTGIKSDGGSDSE